MKKEQILLPYQQKTIQIIENNNVTVIEKSRRIGITWAIACTMTIKLAQQKNDVLYIGYNHSMAREFMQQCAYFVKQYNIFTCQFGEYIIDQNKGIKIFRIDFLNGNKIEALTSEPRSLRGRQGIVVIDEAAFHDKLDEIVKASIPLLIWGGKVVIVSTHNGVDSYFNKIVEDIKKGKNDFALQTIDLYQAVNDGLYKRICLQNDQKWSLNKQKKWIQSIIDIHSDNADEELFCIPSQGQNNFLPPKIIEDSMEEDIPVVRINAKQRFLENKTNQKNKIINDICNEYLLPFINRAQKNYQHTIGIDFGRKNDLSVFWVMKINQELKRKTILVVELANTPFEQQKQILIFIADRIPKLTCIALDATGNGAYLAEVAQQKYPDRVKNIILSEKWYRDNMPKFKAEFEDGNITIPKDADILADLRALKIVRGVAKIPNGAITKDSRGIKRHGDAAIACALASFAARAENHRYEWYPIFKKDDEETVNL